MKLSFNVYYPEPLSGEIDPIYVDDDSKCVNLIRSPKPGMKMLRGNIPIEPRTSLPSRCATRLLEARLELNSKEIMKYNSFDEEFPNGPHPPKQKMIDVIIVNDEVLENLDYFGTYNGLLKYRNRAQSRIATFPSPSDVAGSVSHLRTTVEGKDTVLHIGRPPSNHGLPTSVFSPILAKLKRSLDNLDAVSISHLDLVTAYDYIEGSLHIYDTEISRDDTMKPILEKLVGLTGRIVKSELDGSKVKPDTRWEMDGVAHTIEEGKNETGKGGDPSLQAIISYEKCISQPKCARFSKICNMPAVLLGTSSTRFEVSSAVFTDGVYADKLFSLDLYSSAHFGDVVKRLAQAAVAIKNCAHELRRFYHDLSLSDKPSDKQYRHLFPNPTPITLGGRPVPEITYESRLSRTNGDPIDPMELGDPVHGQGLFLAKIDSSGKEVVVKFTPQYNERAHRLLADAEPTPLAPALYACVRVVGDLYMVIMERTNGPSLFHVGKPWPRYAFEDLSRAVKILHQNKLVFGDLRDTNVLLPQEKKCAILVDFDRCDEHLKGKYPPLTNDTLYGDSGILRGAVMDMKHDDSQLRKLEVDFDLDQT